MSDYADRLRKMRDAWKNTKPATSNSNVTVPEGRYKCELKRAKFDEKCVAYFGFVIREGEFTNAWLNVRHDLLFQPKDPSKSNGLAYFKGTCQTLGIEIEDIDPRVIENALRKAATSGIMAEVDARHATSNGRLFVNGYVVRALNATPIDGDDDGDLDDEPDTSMDDEEAPFDEDAAVTDIKVGDKFIYLDGERNRTVEIFKLNSDKTRAKIRANVGKGTKEWTVDIKDLKPIVDKPKKEKEPEVSFSISEDEFDSDSFADQWGDD